jgi:hypothetical protein
MNADRHAFSWSLPLAFLLLATFAGAQDLTTPVLKTSKFTYADLLRRICPDLKIAKDDPATGTATKTVPIRRLYGKDPPEEWDVPIKIENVNTLDAKIDGAPQLLLQFDIKGEDDHPTRHLALFDIAAAPRLLDVVESPSTPDDPGSLWGKGLLHLSPTSDAFVFQTDHSNSSQAYQSFTILFVNNQHISQIEDVKLLSCTGCQSGTFTENATITTAPDLVGGWKQIAVRVVLRTGKSMRVYSAIYRWNAAKQNYIATSNALQLLEAFNQKNY